jgi:soluble lytic murein transglycosylase
MFLPRAALPASLPIYMLYRLERSLFFALIVHALLVVGCYAQQSEDQALASLRQMTSSGKLPSEEPVAAIENRFSGKRTGALARLLRARIKFEQNDFAGAANLLDSDIFKKHTKLADYALWLRGKALQGSGDHVRAMDVFSTLIRSHADSIRLADARILWAKSALASGRNAEIPTFLVENGMGDSGDALLLIAKSYEARQNQAEAINFYRRTYFLAPGTPAATEAAQKLTSIGQSLQPTNAEELAERANRLAASNKHADALAEYATLASSYPAAVTPAIQLRRLTAMASIGRMTDAGNIFASLQVSAKEREEALRQLILGYARSKFWPQARNAAEMLRTSFPQSRTGARALVDAGLAAREAKNRAEEGYFFNLAATAFPGVPEIASAQFETAWYQHEGGNTALAADMFVDHLARYADKDNTNRGKAGYWAARDSEKAGRIADACALYDGVTYRYSANWYGYLAAGRLSALKSRGECQRVTPASPGIAKAVANLRVVTVVPETAGERELRLAEKSDELSIVGLFDWAIDELNEAKKTAGNSPKINTALARHYRWKGDNTNALITMMKSYPDYAQMFPEEMGREEWSLFYPLTDWPLIKQWANARGLDPYQVAGVIRQETVFSPKAKSPAKAYGYMQLIMPTAVSTARKYNASVTPRSPEDLFNPAVNIELGTAYMKDQLAKFGRFEYMGVAYNAGPGRVPQWRATLPAEMDEFVEAIPFKETKGYVQGIIRNSAQYRRLYDENGNFKPNVGTKPLRGEVDTKSPDQIAAEFPEVYIDRGAE